ncbi:MAG: DoxX family protein, partial [Flammeovirgaceae bacterium]|nr:DoxX family protein [Flammeovirgaceae bacterium]
MTTPARIIFWIARLLAALIMLQTLYFKFTGAEESVYIFTQVGMEPWGRIG